MKSFKGINPESITDNPFVLIGSGWMLIAVGTEAAFNMMTASWGGLGILWEKKICYCVVRPTRYTYTFMEKSDLFTLSFLEEQYRDILTYCGTISGRDVNKAVEMGLTPVFDNGAIYFAEARMVLVCRKLYFHDITPDHFIDPSIDEFYPQKDYHRMYVGEIINCLEQ
jgi:flavin reductase (DIM6/NTAB) family NADH-FMN oxidoreductase RutF